MIGLLQINPPLYIQGPLEWAVIAPAGGGFARPRPPIPSLDYAIHQSSWGG